jgi:multidrug resistance efflux pump
VTNLRPLFFGIPWLIRAFNTISTDDAYVNGYVTLVAPRVSGQVTRVLVEDNNRVTVRRVASIVTRPLSATAMRSGQW